MVIRRLLISLLLGACALASATDAKLGLYLQGNRIGEATYSSRPDKLGEKQLTRGDSLTTFSMGMLGSPMTIEVRSTSWVEPSGRPVQMTFETKSAGRTQVVQARFGETHADVSIEAGGKKTTKRLELPKGAPIVDDPMTLILTSVPNERKTFFVLHPDTVSFVKNEIILKGKARTTVGDRTVDATLVEIIDPQATLRVFIDGKGELVKAEGPLGIEMIPETGGPLNFKPSGQPDLAEASSIRPDKTLSNPAQLDRLTIKLEGANLDAVPSDDHQTTKKDGDGWTIDVHPPRTDESRGVTIREAMAAKRAWVEPDTYIPSDSAEFKDLAKEVIGDEPRVRDAALKVQRYVAGKMRVNAGIGVLRDASEILRTSEGVCRDSAILAATILRAGGVPTRLASGLVSWDGRFYYHAWVEVWDGKRWLGIDPTTTDPQMSAAHIKLSGGNISDAFRFPLLDKVFIRVLRAEGRQ